MSTGAFGSSGIVAALGGVPVMAVGESNGVGNL
jgi:hypothetical protein